MISFSRFNQHPLAEMMRRVQRNARTCIYTEPLWAIPNALYAPFVSVYMAALGLSDSTIGLVGSVAMLTQFIGSLLGGVLTDKLGRRFCTFAFDLLAWTVPTLLWACAGNATWFLLAAVCNGAMRITTNSWNLLLVEDEDPRLLVNIFTAVNIAAYLSAFFAPLSFLLVQRFGVVVTMRWLYGIACVSMTVKFALLYLLGTETGIGQRRMAATRGKSVLTLLGGNGQVVRQMLRTPRVVLTVALLACYTTSRNIIDSFQPLLITSKLGVTTESLSLYAMLRTVVMLVCSLTVVPRISTSRFMRPMLAGLAVLAVSKLIIVGMPSGATGLLVLSMVLEAGAMAMLMPLTESLQIAHIDPEERARMIAMLYGFVLLVSSPFTYIAGLLSENVSRLAPFALGITFYALAALLTVKLWRLNAPEQREEA